MSTVHQNIIDRIQEYLKRLGTDEDFEKVRADFAKEFEEVDAADIMQAEQQLLQNGTPLEEVGYGIKRKTPEIRGGICRDTRTSYLYICVGKQGIRKGDRAV